VIVSFTIVTHIAFFSISANAQALKTPSSEDKINLDSIKAPEFQDLKKTARSIKVKTVIDPLTFTDSKGDVYRLKDLDSPALSDPNVSEDLVKLSKTTLAAIIAGKDLILLSPQRQKDFPVNRMGHTLIHAVTNDDVWIEGTMLANGIARLKGDTETIPDFRLMLGQEKNAQNQKKGLWAYPRYQVINANNFEDISEGYHIAEGKIESVSLVKNNIYLNFGKNWKTDFSAGLPSSLRKDFAKKGLNPMNWAHKIVRLRGYVRDYNGPFVDIDSTYQIEILDNPNEAD